MATAVEALRHSAMSRSSSDVSADEMPLEGSVSTHGAPAALTPQLPPSPAPSTPSRSDSDFDDHRLPATPTRVRIGESGIGGERGEKLEDVRATLDEIPVKLEKTTQGKGRYVLKVDETRLKGAAKRRGKYADLVFTPRSTTFDPRTPLSSKSEFFGFFTLIWLGVFLLMMKTMLQTYRESGTPLGIDILAIMFNLPKLLDCLLTDAVMFFGTTLWCVPLQLAIRRGWLSWDRSGWILQSVWQLAFFSAVIKYMLWHDWPWIQTVFVVLHCFVLLMKQHSYAFLNGYLSEVWKRREKLRARLHQLERMSGPDDDEEEEEAISTSAAAVTGDDGGFIPHLRKRRPTAAAAADLLDSDTPVVPAERHRLCAEIAEEINACTAEMTTAPVGAPAVSYPNNLTVSDYVLYLHYPTVVYELSYPRTRSISTVYVLEHIAATFGILCTMVIVSQTYIYPVVLYCNSLAHLPFAARLAEWPWVALDLLFPFMFEYMAVWYLIWEVILNLLAELTRFDDRGFYGPWWNSTTWDKFAREWNAPVHNFLLRHVYHSSISTWKLSRSSATLITFFLSAVVHEMVMWAIFKKFRGYLMAAQMLQVPLVAISRHRWFEGKRVAGNVLFWVGIYTGPSFLCSIYLLV